MVKRCLNCMNTYTVADERAGGNCTCPMCGFVENTPPREAYHLHPGATLFGGRYTVGTVVGFGGFGVTYRAWDVQLGITVAIKEYFPSGLVQRIPGDKQVIVYEGRQREEFDLNMERFLDEARNMAKFKDNPNIVDVENYFEENNTAYIVMEFLDGISLKDYLKQESGKIDYESALEVILPIADALKEIHSKGIVHRDVSPDNIYLCQGGPIKLLDFGAARLSDEDRERTRSIILKVGYAPPEQYQSKSKQGAWTDIYALCATLYRMTTGVLPEEATNRVLEDTLVPPMQLEKTIPEYLSNAILKGMAINYELRFRNIDELKLALLNKKKAKDPKAELRSRKIKRAIGIAAASLVVVAGACVSLYIYHDKSDTSLDAANITIWVSYDDTVQSATTKTEAEGQSSVDEDSTQAVNALAAAAESASEKLTADQPDVSVEVVMVPADEYADRLAAAAGTDDMPDVYETKYAGDTVLSEAASAEEVYNHINLDEYYFLSEYKDELDDRVPLGFNVPVAYVRRDYNVNQAESVEISSLEQIKTDSEDGYYIAPEYYAMTLNSLGGNYTYDGRLTIDDAAKEALESINESDVIKNFDITGNADAMESFVDGSCVDYYLASVKELQDFNEEAAGLYDMRTLTTDKVYAEFDDCLSIDGGGSKAEIYAAQIYVSYFLTDSAQRTLHITNKSSVPLEKTAYDSFVAGNSAYANITEYIEKAVFYPKTQDKLRELSGDLFENAIAGKQTIDEWIAAQTGGE